MTVSYQALCEATSKSTGKGCQQPERWLEEDPTAEPDTVGEMRVCQLHGKQLERQGWTFVRELHPVEGSPFTRQAVEA